MSMPIGVLFVLNVNLCDCCHTPVKDFGHDVVIKVSWIGQFGTLLRDDSQSRIMGMPRLE